MSSDVWLIYSSTRITAHSTALICQDTDLRGEITIGQGTVIHPKAAILAIGGPVIIGNNCVVEETAVIVNRYSPLLPRGTVLIGQGETGRCSLVTIMFS